MSRLPLNLTTLRCWSTPTDAFEIESLLTNLFYLNEKMSKKKSRVRVIEYWIQVCNKYNLLAFKGFLVNIIFTITFCFERLGKNASKLGISIPYLPFLADLAADQFRG